MSSDETGCENPSLLSPHKHSHTARGPDGVWPLRFHIKTVKPGRQPLNRQYPWKGWCCFRILYSRVPVPLQAHDQSHKRNYE